MRLCNVAAAPIRREACTGPRSRLSRETHWIFGVLPWPAPRSGLQGDPTTFGMAESTLPTWDTDFYWTFSWSQSALLTYTVKNSISTKSHPQQVSFLPFPHLIRFLFISLISFNALNLVLIVRELNNCNGLCSDTM